MFCNYSHKYNPFWFSTKICHKVALTIDKYYSKSTIKVPRKSAKIYSKLTKISKRHDRHCRGFPVVKLTFVCRVVAPLIFKNVSTRKTVHSKCKADSAPRNRSENGASCQNC